MHHPMAIVTLAGVVLAQAATQAIDLSPLWQGLIGSGPVGAMVAYLLWERISGKKTNGKPPGPIITDPPCQNHGDTLREQTELLKQIVTNGHDMTKEMVELRGDFRELRGELRGRRDTGG